MVSTRRSTATAQSTHAATKPPDLTKPSSDTIHVYVPSNRKANEMPMTPKTSSTPGKEPSGNISEHVLSLTSPSTGNVPEEIPSSKSLIPSEPPGLSEKAISYSPPKLAPKPLVNMSGSCHNPIIVEETLSPPRPIVRAPKRKHRHGGKKIPEPHQFMGKGYKDLYNYGVARLDITAMPAHGSTFTGHKNHDIYRMMHAKISAAPDFRPNAARAHHTPNASSESQHLRPAHILTQQHDQSKYQSPYTQPYVYPTPMICYPATPLQSENMLRDKAAQYVREFSGASKHKRMLSDVGSVRISDQEGEQRMINDQHSKPLLQYSIIPPSTPQISAHRSIHQTVHRGINIHHLAENTSLITSLLQTYPSSSNQGGLREDISILASLQHQHITEWLKAESQHSPKRRKNNTDASAFTPDNRKRKTTTLETRVANKEDTALRRVFSAGADMWQDGTGHGVADVFAAAPTPPVARPTQYSRRADNVFAKSEGAKHTSRSGSGSTSPNNTAPTTPKRKGTAKRSKISSLRSPGRDATTPSSVAKGAPRKKLLLRLRKCVPHKGEEENGDGDSISSGLSSASSPSANFR
ncbi:hypothetical protein Alg215_03462 [Pyrenophora tritici-repentis]|nr:hypothetical protein Alg215_03462 [Pyrenophora tritici-repentis]